MTLPYTAAAIATQLIAAADPAALLARAHYDALDLLIELHQHVISQVLHNLPQAQRVAALAALVAARHPSDHLAQAQNHWTQGVAVNYIPDHIGALQHYDSALVCYEQAATLAAPATLRRDVRIVHIVRVFCLTELGRYREALAAVVVAEQWLEAQPNDHAGLTLLLNRSLLAGSMGEYAQMVDLADATIALAKRLGNTARLAQSWINRGMACAALGRFTEAEHAIDRGCAAATAAGESLTLARGQWNRARLLRLKGQLFAAHDALQEARGGLAQAPGEAATVALEQAALALRLQQLPEALRAARSAVTAYAAQGLAAYSANAAIQATQIAARYGHLRAAYSTLAVGRRQAALVALPLLDAELALAEGAVAARLGGPSGANRNLRDRVRHALAALERAEIHGQAAEGRLINAALAARSGQLAEARAAYATLLDHPAAYLQMEARAGLAALLPPAEALPHLQIAATIATAQRRMLPTEELQARYSSQTSPYHVRLAQAQLALGQPEAAIETLWAARAGPLLDLRASKVGISGPAQTTIDEAKAAIELQREAYHDHAHKAQTATLRDQHERAAHHLRYAEASYATLRSSEQALSEALRGLGDRGGHSRVPRVDEVQAVLQPDSALIEYLELDGELGCLLLRGTEPPRYQALGPANALIPLLDRWALICGRGAAGAAIGQVEAVLAALRSQLLGPIEQELHCVRELLISPYGALNRLPWLALAKPEQAVILLPGGALIAAEPPHALAPPGPPRLLGYAGRDERHLPAVESELRAIARHLPAASLHSPATIDNLRAGPAPRLLHIAAHGQTNRAAPLCSTIELADGPLLLLEVHRLDLRGTQLAVLSACETGLLPDQGDMTLALAGAFLAAGAGAVVASLWPVSDSLTAKLMEHFYALMATGQPPALALATASQAARADHPIDWAAFQIWAAGRL